MRFGDFRRNFGQYMALFDGTNCYCENVPPEEKGATRDDELGWYEILTEI